MLEKELETYKKELQTLLQNAGKFVLIHEDKVAGVWDTYQDALQEGYRVFGLKPFLVKQIQAVETVHHINRDVLPICQS
jgi:hypothetical protein